MTDQQELIEIAKIGVLHLLAVRLQRHTKWQKWLQNPDSNKEMKEQQNYMAEHKIIERLQKPRVKHHQLSAKVEQNKENKINNPYLRAGMTSEIIAKAIEELVAERKIVKLTNVAASKSDREDDIEAAENDSGIVKKNWHTIPHVAYVITDTGMTYAKHLNFTIQEGLYSHLKLSGDMPAVQGR